MFLHHICIQTNCYDESLAFYTDILGMRIVEETKDFHGRDYNTWLELGDFMIELQTGKRGIPLAGANKECEGITHFCFSTEDMDGMLQKMLDKGYQKFRLKEGQIMYEVFGQKLFKAVAPEGTIIEFRSGKGI